MRELTLYLKQSKDSKTIEIEEIAAIGKRRLLGPGGAFKKQAWPSIDALCYLILHTYLVRTTRRTLGSEVEIVKTPTKARNLLKTLWSSKPKKGLKWKKTLFEGDPFEKTSPYLVTSGSDVPDTFEIWIPLDVEIELIEADHDTKILTNQLRDLAHRLAVESHDEPPRLLIELKMDDHRISSSWCSGFLSRGHRIQICIEWNFVSSLFVCWINSRNEIKFLFPDSSFKKLDHPHDFSSSNGKSTLSIPAFEELQIKSPPGLETCLVLSTHDVLPRAMQVETASLLKQSLTARDSRRKISEPIFKPLQMGGQVPPPGRRVEMVDESDAWEREIEMTLGKLFDSAYAFHIPNR